MGSRAGQPLSREAIVAAALDLVERGGLEGLTMRALARDLGVQAMSLYHWFPSKADVMDALLDDFAAAVRVPADGDFAGRLSALSHLFRVEARKRAALFPFLAMHRFNTELGLETLEGILSLFADAIPEPAPRAAAFRMYIHWMIGYCLDETSGFAKGPSARNPPSPDEIARRFPRVAALGPYNRPEHFDALFEVGLAAITRAILDLRNTGPGRG